MDELIPKLDFVSVILDRTIGIKTCIELISTNQFVSSYVLRFQKLLSSWIVLGVSLGLQKLSKSKTHLMPTLSHDLLAYNLLTAHVSTHATTITKTFFWGDRIWDLFFFSSQNITKICLFSTFFPHLQ